MGRTRARWPKGGERGVHSERREAEAGGDVIAHRIARKIYLNEDNNLRGWKGRVLYALYVVLAFVEDLLGLPV